MAYGLNVTDLIYTDDNLIDQGVLDDYEADLDINGDLDFELRCNDFIMSKNCIWYIEGTEFGGIVDGYETNSSAWEVTYRGRNWRGILHSKYIYNGEVAVEEITDDYGDVVESSSYRYNYSGKIVDIFNSLFEDYDLSDLFYCEEPYITEEDSSMSTDVVEAGYLPFGESGISIYDAMEVICDSVNLNMVFKYELSDRRVHVYLTTPRDYSDVMNYNRDNSSNFEVGVSDKIPNHLIVVGEQTVDKKSVQRIIHLFLDENNVIQQYCTESDVFQREDSDYILDDSKKVITGIREIVELLHTSFSTVANYEKLTSDTFPSELGDWKKEFSKYFTYTEATTDEETGEEISESYNKVEGILQSETYKTLKSLGITERPVNWDTEYSQYYENTGETYDAYNDVWKDDYATLSEIDVDDLKHYTKVDSNKQPANWSTEYNEYYTNLRNDGTGNYTADAISGVQKNKFVKTTTKPTDWNQLYMNYYTRQVFSATKKTWSKVSAKVNQLLRDGKITTFVADKTNNRIYGYTQIAEKTKDSVKKVTKKPSKWSDVYGNYLYKRSIGQITKGQITKGYEYTQYNANSKDTFVLLNGPKPPYDWKKNYKSYYTKVWTKKVKSKKAYNSLLKRIKKQLKKQEKKRQFDEYTVTKKSGANEWTVKTYKSIKSKKAPKKWSRKKFYRKDSKQIVPSFKSGNTYYSVSVVDKSKIPKWKKNTYFKLISYETAPSWKTYKDRLYLPHKIKQIPFYSDGRKFNPSIIYKKITDIYKAPDYAPNKYYREIYDNYYELVQTGIEHLKGLVSENYQKMTLNDDYILNIGDLVSGTDDMTGEVLDKRAITNIIVKIDSGSAQLDYVVEDAAEEAIIPEENLEPANGSSEDPEVVSDPDAEAEDSNYQQDEGGEE